MYIGWLHVTQLHATQNLSKRLSFAVASADAPAKPAFILPYVGTQLAFLSHALGLLLALVEAFAAPISLAAA